MGITRNFHDENVQKSIGVSQTFKPISEYNEYREKVIAMAHELYERLWDSKLIARTITLEFKSTKFNNKQRSYTFQNFIYEKSDIVKASDDLLKYMYPFE